MTAGRRLPIEAAGHPAYFVVFDLLLDTGGRVLLDQPLTRRRRRRRRLLAGAPPQLPLCRKPPTNPPPALRGRTGPSPVSKAFRFAKQALGWTTPKLLVNGQDEVLSGGL